MKNKEELISLLDPIISEDSFLQVYFIVKRGDENIVLKANINEENGKELKSNIIKSYKKKKEFLQGLDGDVYDIATNIDANQGVLYYSLDNNPNNFNLLSEVASHNVEEDDFFWIGKGHSFLNKEELPLINGFIFSIGKRDIGYAYIYRKKHNFSLFQKSKLFKFRDGKFTLYDDYLLSIDGVIDYLLIDNEFYVFNNSVIETYGDIATVVKNTAKGYVDDIEAMDIVDNCEFLKNRIDNEMSFARKVISAAKLSPVKKLAKADIIKFINKQKDLKKIFKPSEDKVYLSTRAAQNAFIKLLDDDYVKSSLSKKNYDALKKKRR